MANLSDFVWDEDKNKATVLDRNISFEMATKIWDDPKRCILGENSRGNEQRWVMVGKIDGKFHTVIYTIREGKYRIISCRRSWPKEVKVYGQ